MSQFLLTAIGGVVVLFVLVALVIVNRLRVAGPNQAFIITGRKGKPVRNPETGEISTDMSGQKVVMGAAVFVLPFVQRLHIMDLSSRRISVGIRGAVSSQGIKCDLEGVAIVKVGGNEDAIRASAQRFLNQQQGIEVFTQEVLAGSLRAIVGRLTVEEIIKDRAAFASAVAEEAETSLTNQGLALDTFQLQDIQAEGDYLADLGRPEAARVEKEAAIAEARARQAAEQERLLAEEQIAVAERQLQLRKAEIQAETDAANARAAAAGPLAQAARDQEVLAEQEKVAQRNAALKDRQLDTEIRKPADAERYRVEQEAESGKRAAILHAEAERESTIAAAHATAEQARLSGEGERSRRAALAEAEEIEGRARGTAEKLRREAIAEAVQREGEAEAAAILAKGQAEAQAREKNADAFRQYGDAAILDLVVQVMPDLVRSASEPLAAVDRMTVISADGASSLARSVAANVEQGLQIGSDLTGLDLRALFSRLGTKSDGGDTPSPTRRDLPPAPG
ncbi:MAG TPA: SPFH domain-containing protein [Egibacteraceae bacterium]|nr:SPFH domain-containing protein [Actinomycetota bacterium]HWB71676.1 SPFH domain-containing protein [Egibacteraceae bacterium]